MGLRSGLPAELVAERLRRAATDLGEQRRVLSFFLCEMEERRLYQLSGHGSTVHFGQAQLEMRARRVREYLQIGRSLTRLELVDDAFCAGEIGWAKVVALLPVVQRETQKAWVEFATGASYRELRREVARCRPGQLPGEGEDFGAVARRVEFRAALSDVQRAIVEEVRMRLSNGDGEPLDDEALIVELARRVLSTMGPESGKTEKPASGRGAPAAEIEGAVRNDEPIPDEVRDHVRRRDRNRCRNCETFFDIDIHHLRHRRDGGDNAPANLLCLCKVCHGSMHRGFLLALGDPDSRSLLFTARDGTPVERGGRPPRAALSAIAT